ncbi:hypothetical protein BU17DRAFT_69268 [Hysterangium stoloniferum]|nr:hypothetical protein BU17DRAFT_69268 [Hysterangium stoloniferum]
MDNNLKLFTGCISDPTSDGNPSHTSYRMNRANTLRRHSLEKTFECIFGQPGVEQEPVALQIDADEFVLFSMNGTVIERWTSLWTGKKIGGNKRLDVVLEGEKIGGNKKVGVVMKGEGNYAVMKSWMSFWKRKEIGSNKELDVVLDNIIVLIEPILSNPQQAFADRPINILTSLAERHIITLNVATKVFLPIVVTKHIRNKIVTWVESNDQEVCETATTLEAVLGKYDKSQVGSLGSEGPPAMVEERSTSETMKVIKR